MTAEQTRQKRARAAVLVTPAVVSVMICLAGWWPTQARVGESGVGAMLRAQAVLLVILYATLLPMAGRMPQAAPVERLRLAFRAAGQRFVLTLLAAGTIAWMRPADRRTFLVWIALSYVALTLAETIALVRWMKTTEKRACT